MSLSVINDTDRSHSTSSTQSVKSEIDHTDPASKPQSQLQPQSPSDNAPCQFSAFYRWFILFIIALQGFLGPLSSSIYIPAIYRVKKDFNVSTTGINATISIYIYILGVAPMIWAVISERHSRRRVYIISTAMYVVSTLGCAASKSIGLFVTMRIFQAAGASAAQAVGAGTIIDLFQVHDRGKAMGLFFLGPLVGPVIGPIAGGYISQYFHWRDIFWSLAAVGGFVLLLMICFLPETGTRSVKIDESAIKAMLRPLSFLLEKIVVLASIPYAIAFGFMYFVIASLSHELITRYHFTSSQVGLAYLANGTGNAIGAMVSGKCADWILRRNSDQRSYVIEHRLSVTWLGVVLLCAGELMYGWCVQLQLSVVAVLAGLFLLGLGVGIIQTPSNTYVMDAYEGHAASAMSASNLMRCTWAGCTPLMAPFMLHRMGNGWSLTVIASVSALSGICIFLVQHFGHRWRNAKCHPLP
ncbi:major facilitator superfamily domain-containing protein [Radiomyces spectabilis]|uniref:major facilitator superfamily domain-containing protein n=1 Tax=Radiomyces spectabilis TaxID=64574 RepID=UPI00221E6DAC|nr:major facilitator superfamily domain-containing protein [Radiomyces spectabilis]KAI8390910.1 major facilitator superfamily domain-containing protein [Radiomyces spectabilis]